MNQNQAQSFVFVGDTTVGAPLVSSLLQAGFEGADSLESADVIFTYHESQTSLEDIYYEEPGLISIAKEGAVLVDLSPSSCSFAQEVFAVSAVNGIAFVDAPLVVVNVALEAAFALPSNLICFVGAEAKTYDTVSPMLHALAQKVSWMGAVGAGQIAKAAATVQSASNVVAIIEAYNSFALSSNLSDFEEYVDTMETAGVFSEVQVAFIDALINKDYKGSYTVEIMMGELLAAFASFEERDISLPQMDAAFHLFELLAIVGGASFNPAALVLVYSAEEEGKKYNLDWSRAAGAYDTHDDDCDCEDKDDPNHECTCGHHH